MAVSWIKTAAMFESINLNVDYQALWGEYGGTVVAGVLNVIAAAAILIIGLSIAAWAAGTVKKLSKRHPRVDDTLATFFARIVRYGLVGIVIIAVLNRFGVATTSIVAVLGAATLAIGLALQGTLSNVAAGVMLIMFRPYRLGDFVEVGGGAGTVTDITLFTTNLTNPENHNVIVPNGVIWGSPMINYTANPTRRIDLEFGVSYDTDMDKAIAVLLAAAKAHDKVLSEPEPVVDVKSLDDFAVVMWMRVWTPTPDWFATKQDLIKAGKEALDANNITIPFPTSLNYEVWTNKPEGLELKN